jgi:hypothetical protein
MPPTPAPPEPDDAVLEQGLRGSRGLEDAPEHLIQRTLASLQTLQRRRATPPGLLQRVLAVLVFDSAHVAGHAFGVRSAAAGLRQLVYSADGIGIDIDLRLAAAAGGAVQLSGQVLGTDATLQLRLAADGQPAHEQALDSAGQFTLPPLPAGRYTLQLQLAGTEIELPALDLGAPG